ncbi:MAG: hypothetical protein R3Y61_02800 [Rikenellaceae bacterium]
MPLWGGGTALFCSFLPKQIALHSLSASQPHCLTASLPHSPTQPYPVLLSSTP